jgi:hypothetical protein
VDLILVIVLSPIEIFDIMTVLFFQIRQRNFWREHEKNWTDRDKDCAHERAD